MSLDRLEAAVPTMATAPHVQAAPLRNAPPAITIASVPTVLVLVQGKPALQEIPGTKLERVINTQMLLARDSARAWWLKIADGWMTAKTLAGPWTVGDAAGNADLAAALLVSMTATFSRWLHVGSSHFDEQEALDYINEIWISTCKLKNPEKK
ncbi:MAG: hypothetical protein EBR07_12940 [Planctomycetes bacterium]|nr:hypothetical protein [Planctomycetota bacterium]